MESVLAYHVDLGIELMYQAWCLCPVRSQGASSITTFFMWVLQMEFRSLCLLVQKEELYTSKPTPPSPRALLFG